MPIRSQTVLLVFVAMTGCARVPVYLEPAGHSTTYRLHAEHHDRVFAPDSAAVFVEPVASGRPPPEQSPPPPHPVDDGVDVWSADDGSGP